MARPRRPRKTVYILNLLIVLAVAWLGGFVWFLMNLQDTPKAPDQRTDGIVVLTGGAFRIALAQQLLADGKAQRLLISGVYDQLDDETLRRATGIPDDLFACCVDLGRSATNTQENAAEAAAWATGRGYRSLRVVTAYDHLPRSILEFRRAMPAMELVPHPVSPATVGAGMNRPGLGRLALEYAKYSRVWLLIQSDRLRRWAAGWGM